MNKPMKIIILVLLFLIVLGLIYIRRPTPQEPTIDITTLTLFKEGLKGVNIQLDELGYHSFSSDGKYFLFTGIKDKDTASTKVYLLNLVTEKLKLLPGFMFGDFIDDRIIATIDGDNLVLYNTESGKENKISTNNNPLFSGFLSMDGSLYVINSLTGIKVYNLETNTLESISNKQYDGAYAWFSDSKRMFGFKQNNNKAFEAGYERDLGIWNIKSKNFTPLKIKGINSNLIRSTFWIIPDKIVRINTGWDDGSHDYILNIETGEIKDIGETSGALMGGMKHDINRGLFAVVNSNQTLDKPSATIYKGMEKISSSNLPENYIRENIQIVNENTLLYIRKHLGKNFIIDENAFIKLDVGNGSETVLKILPLQEYGTVSLYSDYKTWVVTAKNKFFTGKLE